MSGFEQALRSAALRWPMHEARLVRMVAAGRCPRRLLQALAACIFQGADHFTGGLARLVEAAPHCELRAHLLENLLEESGLRVVAGRGMRFDADQVHLGWARRFARACGLDDAALDTEASRRLPRASCGFEEMFRLHGWLGAASYLLAQEANMPQTLEPMLRGLQALGFQANDLVMFSAHIEADERHGSNAFALLARQAASEGERECVLRCVERGARDWWQMHN